MLLQLYVSFPKYSYWNIDHPVYKNKSNNFINYFANNLRDQVGFLVPLIQFPSEARNPLKINKILHKQNFQVYVSIIFSF